MAALTLMKWVASSCFDALFGLNVPEGGGFFFFFNRHLKLMVNALNEKFINLMHVCVFSSNRI